MIIIIIINIFYKILIPENRNHEGFVSMQSESITHISPWKLIIGIRLSDPAKQSL